jgi:hypothetical protein
VRFSASPSEDARVFHHRTNNRARSLRPARCTQWAYVVYCFGYLTYVDEIGSTIHRAGFVRRFDIRYRWWRRADFEDADFEYAD